MSVRSVNKVKAFRKWCSARPVLTFIFLEIVLVIHFFLKIPLKR